MIKEETPSYTAVLHCNQEGLVCGIFLGINNIQSVDKLLTLFCYCAVGAGGAVTDVGASARPTPASSTLHPGQSLSRQEAR